MSPSDNSIGWRIPTAGDPILLRLGLAQVGLASLVAAFAILLAAPAEWRALALVGLIPLAVFVAYRRWARYQREFAGPHNVRLDEAGLHWLDTAGQQQRFARQEIVGFCIAPDSDTLRPVPALTLMLAGGFESQPIELHPPATESEIRRLLTEQWQLPEQTGPREEPRAYDLAIDVYSECHDDFQEWHWEGTRAALVELLDAIAEVASFPPPPLGARPLGKKLLLRRRESSLLLVQHDRHTRLAPEAITATGEKLLELIRLAATRLQEERSAAAAPAASAASASAAGELPATADLKFDLPLGRGNQWTFHLHVRE